MHVIVCVYVNALIVAHVSAYAPVHVCEDEYVNVHVSVPLYMYLYMYMSMLFVYACGSDDNACT